MVADMIGIVGIAGIVVEVTVVAGMIGIVVIAGIVVEVAVWNDYITKLEKDRVALWVYI